MATFGKPLALRFVFMRSVFCMAMNKRGFLCPHYLLHSVRLSIQRKTRDAAQYAPQETDYHVDVTGHTEGNVRYGCVLQINISQWPKSTVAPKRLLGAECVRSIRL